MVLARKDPVRIKDLAEHFGVSPSTVSRALSPKGRSLISADLAARIRAKAEEMGYVGDVYATGLRTGRTRTVGVIIPDIQNPIFPPIVRGIQNRMDEAGLVTLIAYSDNRIDLARREVERLLGRRVDGLIYASAFLEDPVIDFCHEQGVSLVLLNRSVRGARGIYHEVLNDEAEGIRQTVAHLAALGHRRIVHFNGPVDVLQGLERREALRRYAAEYGLEAQECECTAFSREEGARCARQFLSAGPSATAIVAGNDLIAIGAVQVFKEAGLRVPDEVSVVGFNGMPFSEMFDPPLTTVAIPHVQLGARAAEILLGEMQGESEGPLTVKLEPVLVARRSSGPAPDGAVDGPPRATETSLHPSIPSS